jgi:hypothetical protein
MKVCLYGLLSIPNVSIWIGPAMSIPVLNWMKRILFRMTGLSEEEFNLALTTEGYDYYPWTKNLFMVIWNTVYFFIYYLIILPFMLVYRMTAWFLGLVFRMNAWFMGLLSPIFGFFKKIQNIMLWPFIFTYNFIIEWSRIMYNIFSWPVKISTKFFTWLFTWLFAAFIMPFLVFL